MSKEPTDLQDETIQAIFLYALVNQIAITAQPTQFEQGGIVCAESHQGGEVVLSPRFTEQTIGMDFTKQKGIDALNDLRDSLSFQSKPPFQILLA